MPTQRRLWARSSLGAAAMVAAASCAAAATAESVGDATASVAKFADVAQLGKGVVAGQRVRPFLIDVSPVSVGAFARFVEANPGFRTDAERYGWSFVFEPLMTQQARDDAARTDAPRSPNATWWVEVQGASWLRPGGGQADPATNWQLPVTHVSMEDAAAFCRWREGKLPTAAQWEWAAGAGVDGAELPWKPSAGDAATMANLWTAEAGPEEAAAPLAADADGFGGPAPVTQLLHQNDWGMRHLIGNTWEWTQTRFRGERAVPARWDSGTLWTLKGGSFLDRLGGVFGEAGGVTIMSEAGNTADMSSSHIGFRCTYKAAPAGAELVIVDDWSSENDDEHDEL
ncbi:hypothetical protein FNF31_07765 [Cafeteria roenbergensis]|uniref:Sulfatase-modifying factor enzyme-like domain-containing protein n=1 Tax=Cafeteria roenbergensis TaxID=33653 RepID=A0A5A8C1Y1_CAFRO|nr:hypothetical protein FNF31_07765 [Cafeteria roenbergensis]